MKRYAVIPTGNREADYLNVIAWCKAHHFTTVTIATSPEAYDYSVGKVIVNNQLNISRWWNIGLDYIAEKMFANDEEYIVAILNDDVILQDDWTEKLEPYIVQGNSGASGQRWGTKEKISGYAFLLNGRHDMRFDEKFVWYCGDDDMYQQCLTEGGFAIVKGLVVENKYARSSESLFSGQIEKDFTSYREKWSTS